MSNPYRRIDKEGLFMIESDECTTVTERLLYNIYILELGGRKQRDRAENPVETASKEKVPKIEKAKGIPLVPNTLEDGECTKEQIVAMSEDEQKGIRPCKECGKTFKNAGYFLSHHRAYHQKARKAGNK
jgi:hypothetical protein